MVQNPIDKQYLIRQFRNFDSKIVEGKLSEIREDITELQNARDIAETNSTIISDSYAGKLLVNKINGAYEQFTTSGKNLIPYPFKETTHTDNGITFTDNGDGTITANGTATDRSVFIMVFRGEATPIPAGDYVLTGCPSGGSASTYRVALNHIEEGLTAGVDLAYDYGSGKKVSLDHDCNYGVFVRIEPNVTVSNLVFKPMLYRENLVTYPFRETTKTASGITFTDNGDGTITANGTATANSNINIIYLQDKAFKLPAGRYIVSGCPEGGSASTYRVWANTYDSDGVTAIGFGSDYGSGLTIELDEEKYVGIGCQVFKGATVSNITFTPCIKSLTQPDFEPYTGGVASPNPEYPQEIKTSVANTIKTHGKNFIPYPYSEATHTERGITWTDLGDGRVMANGTNTATSNYSWFAFATENTLWLEAGDYILSGCPSGGGSSTYYMRVADNPNTNAIAVTVGGNVPFTLTEAQYVRVQAVVRYGATVNNIIFKPMIRRADVEDDAWEPYKESSNTLSEYIELNRIEVSSSDDYTYEKDGKYYIADTIEKIDGEYKHVQRIGKRLLDGVNNKFTYYAAITSTHREPLIQLNLTSAGLKVFNTVTPYILSDRFHSSVAKVENAIGLYVSSGNAIPVVFVSPDTGITSLETANTWLQSHNFTTYHILAEPIITSLPTVDQVALSDLDTYNVITYVKFDSEVKPVINIGYATNNAGSLITCNQAAVINNKAYVESLVNGLINGES